MASPSIPDMISQSRQVLTNPSVATFERFENSGGLREALIYVALAAAVTGVFGLGGGLIGFLQNIVLTLLGFGVFTYLVYLFGKRQGGTGTFDQVAYTFSLFWGPLAVVFGMLTLLLIITLIGVLFLPLLGLLAIAANVYFAYLAVQSSMNLQKGRDTWMTLLVAGLGTLLFNVIVGALLQTS